MSKEKLALQEKIALLEKQLKVAQASQIHGLYFAAQTIKKASTDKMFGSGVILQLSYLSGEGIFSPIMIANGLSNETIECLIKDMKRSFDYSTELKP